MSKDTKKTIDKPFFTGEIPSTPFRFFAYVSKKYKWSAFLAILCVVIAIAVETSLPLLLSEVVTAAESNDIEKVIILGFLYPFGILMYEIFWRTSGAVFGRQWILGIRKDTSDILASYVFRHSSAYFADRFAGSLLNKIGNTVGAVEKFAHDLLWSHLTTLVQVIVSGVIISSISLPTGLIFTSLVLILIVVNVFLVPRMRAYSLASAESGTRMKGGIVDILGNVSTTRQFVRFEQEDTTVNRLTSDARNKHSTSWLYAEYMKVVSLVLLIGGSFLMFANLVHQWIESSVSTGNFVAIMVIVLNIAHSLTTIGRTFQQTATAYGEAEEGLGELIINHEITDTPNAQKLTAAKGEIDWNDVTFTYGQNKVFDHFNLTIKPGQRVGLVGPSGAGKTTFVSLLLRQHDIDEGAIMIDDQNIAEVTQDSLRSNIAVVPQEPMLFHRTIRENIAYGKPDATDEEIIAVAKKAQAHDFISTLEEGYDTLVGERGVKLSGGQKQRVAIARAMLKDAPILVLDEATSALDSESEVLIQKALHELMEGKTVIAVAHRLSTLREMDRIIVMERGKIVEDGTPSVLLKKENGIFKAKWEQQKGGFVA